MATDQDKLVELKTAAKGDGSRYSATNVDVIENCTVFCKVKVKDRKGPLKIYINYNGLKGQQELNHKQATKSWSLLGNLKKQRPKTAKLGRRGQ